jgi:uncharacterized protein
MSLSLYQSSVPAFERSLNALLGLLDKAANHAEARKFDPSVYLATRLRPDMWPFARQVQAACDHAKNASARLAGLEPKAFENTETTLDALKARVRGCLDAIQAVDPKALEGGEKREIVFPVGPNKMKMQGDNYLLHFVLPNFYFHMTTAYDILRYCGVEIGKRDFLGAVPGIGPA